MKNNTQFITYVNVPHARGKAEQCNICNKKFGVMTREHQCKRCKRAVCEACSPFKVQHIKKDGNQSSKPHRMCTLCKEESDAMKQFVEQYKLSYGADTFAKEWLKEYGQLESAVKDYQIAKENMNVKLERTEISGLDNINYSLKEFYFLTKKNAEKLKNVIMAFISKYPEIPFSPELVVLTNFLLCFSTDSSAFALLGIIYKHICPAYFITSTEYKQEQQMVMQCLKGLGLKDEDVPLVQGFVARGIKRYVSTFCINMFLFETSFYIISQLIQKYENFIKCVASCIMFSLATVKKNNYDETELYILRNIRTKDLQKLVSQTKVIQMTGESALTLSQDQSLISNLRMDISALKLQISLQQNEIESYKFQLQQDKNPDEKKKDKFLEKKNEEIAILMQKLEEFKNQNKLLTQQLETLKNENKELKQAGSQDEQQLIIIDQRDKIERLQKSLEMQSLIAVERDSVRYMKSSSKSTTDLDDQKIQEYKKTSLEEKQRLDSQIFQLELDIESLNKENAQLKDINKTVAEYIGGLAFTSNMFEFSEKPYVKIMGTDSDDIKNVIETRNQQNILLKQLLREKQMQLAAVTTKLNEIKIMLQS